MFTINFSGINDGRLAWTSGRLSEKIKIRAENHSLTKQKEMTVNMYVDNIFLQIQHMKI